MYHRSFNSNQAKRTFGRFYEPLEAGNYILKKKAQATFCKPNKCVPSITLNTQENKLMLNWANRLKYAPCKNDFNKSNLNVNLITKLQLNNNVAVIQQNLPHSSPTDLDLQSIPYLYYTIDPCGNLFGNTICGVNNWETYIRYNPPSYATT